MSLTCEVRWGEVDVLMQWTEGLTMGVLVYCRYPEELADSSFDNTGCECINLD